MAEPELVWEDDNEGWESFEVQRCEDEVTLVLTKLTGEVLGLNMTPEDATTIGIALAQAGQA